MASVAPVTSRPSSDGPSVATDWQALAPDPLLLRLLDDDGDLHAVDGFPMDLDDTGLAALYRLLVTVRRVDRQAIALTRQGQLGVYASSSGQEAAQVGAVFALSEQDWMFPTYRETVASVARGVDVVDVLALFQGKWHCGFDPYAHRVAPLCTPIGTQTVHATGLAMAARFRRDPVVALAFLGDGGTSEGDPHEAMNFAAVFDAPVVFFVQNNQYAISVPLSHQMKSPTIAHRALGYGMPGVRVDGNDVLAVYAATRRAVDRARAGEGPTLIEAVTYRIEAHTTADDDGRYRSTDEVEDWRGRDPLVRFEAFLRRRGLLDDALETAAGEEAEAMAARMREALYEAPAGDPMELFDHVYADPPAHLLEERGVLQAELDAAREDAP